MHGAGNIPQLPEADLNKYLLLRMGIMINSQSSKEEHILFSTAFYCVKHRMPLLSAEAKADELAKRSGYGLNCFMASFAAPDISKELAKLKEADIPLKVPSVTPEPKNGLSIG